MNRADRQAVAREREAKTRAAEAARAGAAAAATRRADQLRKIDDLVPAALASLEAAGFPGSTVVKTRGRFVRHQRAGWTVASFDVPYLDTRKTLVVFLVSNGRFCVSGDGNPEVGAGDLLVSLDKVIRGLEGLRDRR